MNALDRALYEEIEKLKESAQEYTASGEFSKAQIYERSAESLYRELGGPPPFGERVSTPSQDALAKLQDANAVIAELEVSIVAERQRAGIALARYEDAEALLVSLQAEGIVERQGRRFIRTKPIKAKPKFGGTRPQRGRTMFTSGTVSVVTSGGSVVMAGTTMVAAVRALEEADIKVQVRYSPGAPTSYTKTSGRKKWKR